MLKILSHHRLDAAAFVLVAGLLASGPVWAASDLASEPVVVSSEAADSGDPYDVIYSNVAFLNALFANHVYVEEVPPDALRSYYVDDYIAQMNTGGFAQYVYTSAWREDEITLVRDGLQKMGAVQNLEVFEKGAKLVEELGEKGLEEYLDSDFWAENPAREKLNSINDAFFTASAKEDAVLLNSAWLRKLPNLEIKSNEGMNQEVARRVALLPDLEKRRASALENEPYDVKLIRALAKKAGHELQEVIEVDPYHQHEGKQIVAWHFVTDKGQHYMLEVAGKALMFELEGDKKIAEIDAPKE